MGHDYTVAGSSSSSGGTCQLYITAEGSTLKIRLGVCRTSGNYWSWWYNHSITITVNGTSVSKNCHLNAASASSQYSKTYYTNGTYYYMSNTTGANSRITDPNSSYAVVWQFTGLADAKAITMTFNSGTGGFGTLTVNNSTATRTEHTISFAANGGSSTPSSITNLYNASITLPSAISHSNESISRTVTLSYGGNGNTGGSTAASTGTQSGTRTYTFASWSGYGAGASYTIGTSNATLTAQWTTSDSYNSTTVTTRANGFTRTGYHFKNWNSNTSGTGTAYTAGSGAVSFPANTTAITVYAIWNQDTTIPTGTNFTYDRQSHTGVSSGTGYTLSGTASATNAGSYSATATLSAGRCWTDGTTAAKTISWSIAKRTVTLSWGTVSWTYDGSAHSTTCSAGNVVSGDSCTVTLTGNSVGAAVGTATVTASSLSNSNYQLPSSKTATLTISQREVTLTWGTRSWTYDGSAHSTTCTAGNLVSGTSCTVTLTGNSVGANVGSATVTASSLSNSNYKLPSTKTTTISITARTVTLTWGTTSWVYDGSTHSTTCTAGNLVSGTTCTVTLSNNSVGAGVGSQTVTASALSNSNYALPSSKTTTISITQREVTLTWGTRSWTYDGATHSTTCTAGNLVSGTTCTVTLTGNSVGAGVGTATVTASSLSNSNYKLPSTKTATLTITQRQVTLTWGTPTSWVYDKATHSTTCTAGNLVSGTSCTVTLTNNSVGPNVGSATVTASSLSNSNYKLPSSGLTSVLSITQRTATLSWGTRTWNYDGNAHSTTCTVSNLYSGDTCTVTLSGNSITNPGQTTVTATSLSNTNYILPSTKTAILQINPKITFTSDRGSAPSPIWVVWNSQIGSQLPSMQNISPYNFTGWDVNGTRLSTSTVVTQNLTAVAVWVLGLTLYLYENNVWTGPWPLYRWTGDVWEPVTPYVWTGPQSQWKAN